MVKSKIVRTAKEADEAEIALLSFNLKHGYLFTKILHKNILKQHQAFSFKPPGSKHEI